MTDGNPGPFMNEERRILSLVLLCLLVVVWGCPRPPEDKTEEPDLEEYVVRIRPENIVKPIPLGAVAPESTVQVFRSKGKGNPETYLPLRIISTCSLFTASLGQPNSLQSTLTIQAISQATADNLRKASWRSSDGLASGWICVDLSIEKGPKNIKSNADCTNVTVILDEAAKEILPEIRNEFARISLSQDVMDFGPAKVGEQTIFIQFFVFLYGEGMLNVSLAMDPPSADFRFDLPSSFQLTETRKSRAVGVRFQPTTPGLKTAISLSVVKPAPDALPVPSPRTSIGSCFLAVPRRNPGLTSYHDTEPAEGNWAQELT